MNRREFLGMLSAVSLPSHSASPFAMPQEAHHFLLVGDTQRTSWFERVLLRREQNDHERVLVLNAMASELATPPTQPYSAVILLGDHVCYGEDDEDWRYFDGIFAPVRQQTERLGIPIIALPGNHDYGFVRRSRAFLKSLTARFPAVPRHAAAPLPRFPSVLLFGSTALVMLDSNLDMLSTQAAVRQFRRYQVLLEHLDADPRIASVMVAAHHPPFTNSDLAPDAELMRFVAEPFLTACKTRALFAGHVHSYERFEHRTVSGMKLFVTSGGGGGPRRVVRTDDARPHTNDCYRTGTVRPFHYVRLAVGASELLGEVMMLQPDGTFAAGDEFRLEWEP